MKYIFSITVCVLLFSALFIVQQIKPTASEIASDMPIAPAITPPPPEQPLRLYVIGDMMFDRAVRKQIYNKGFEYVFGYSTTTFAAHDIVIGNLEGPVTSSPSKTLLPNGTQSKDLVFTFPTSTAPALRRLGIDVVSLANNHTDNFGTKGLQETKQLLKESGIQYFGEPTNAGDVATTTCIIKNKKETCIGFVGYHEFTYKHEETVASAIQTLRPQVDFLIVMPHWGNEYKPTYTKRQQQLAHSWIDLGADAVIGAHPHIVTPLEIYKDKPIFYSLGNFIFDQYFSFETTHGLTLSIDLTSTSTTYKLIPIKNTGIHVQDPGYEISKKILQTLADISEGSVSSSTLESIKDGIFTLPRSL